MVSSDELHIRTVGDAVLGICNGNTDKLIWRFILELNIVKCGIEFEFIIEIII